jgi:hypothetical protein
LFTLEQQQMVLKYKHLVIYVIFLVLRVIFLTVSGLSLRDLVLQFKHKALLLFKLLLLERRVLFFRSPVQQLCATILSLLSLHPGMLERGGLNQAACVRLDKLISILSDFKCGDLNLNFLGISVINPFSCLLAFFFFYYYYLYK